MSKVQLTQYELKEAVHYLSCYLESIGGIDDKCTLRALMMKMQKMIELYYYEGE